MAYNEELAYRISESLKLFPEEFEPKKMFGGIAYLYHGKMTIGIIKDDLAVRILLEKYPKVQELEYVRPMDFVKKPMKDFIYVSSKGLETEEQLMQWIEFGLEHAKTKI